MLDEPGAGTSSEASEGPCGRSAKWLDFLDRFALASVFAAMLEGEKQNGARRSTILLPSVVLLFFPVCVCVRACEHDDARARFCACVSAAEAKKIFYEEEEAV